VASGLEIVVSLAMLSLTLYAIARWQAYRQLFQVFAKVAPRVPAEIQDWFYSQLYRLTKSDEEGFHSVWDPSAEATAVLLVCTGIALFVGIASLTAALRYAWFQALSVPSLALALFLMELLLIPRIRLFANSEAERLYSKANSYFDSPEDHPYRMKSALALRVPGRLRGYPFIVNVGVFAAVVVSFFFNAVVQDTRVDTAVNTAFVQALTARNPGGALAQAQAAHRVAVRPTTWDADGLRVVPLPNQVTTTLADYCSKVPVGNPLLEQGLFVCARDLTSAQLARIRQWALQASPKAALALETVSPANRMLAALQAP
jgi:hypothetical protein